MCFCDHDKDPKPGEVWRDESGNLVRVTDKGRFSRHEVVVRPLNKDATGYTVGMNKLRERVR